MLKERAPISFWVTLKFLKLSNVNIRNKFRKCKPVILIVSVSQAVLSILASVVQMMGGRGQQKISF